MSRPPAVQPGGPRPGIAYAGLGLGLSALLVRETRGHADLEAQLIDANPAPARKPNPARGERLSTREVLVRTSLQEPALSACSQAGLVNNLNDGLAWGLLPLLFARGGLPVAQVGLLAALYPAIWGLGQLLTGPLSDRMGRKPLITAGMLLQALALAGTATAGSFQALRRRTFHPCRFDVIRVRSSTDVWERVDEW